MPRAPSDLLSPELRLPLEVGVLLMSRAPSTSKTASTSCSSWCDDNFFFSDDDSCSDENSWLAFLDIDDDVCNVHAAPKMTPSLSPWWLYGSGSQWNKEKLQLHLLTSINLYYKRAGFDAHAWSGDCPWLGGSFISETDGPGVHLFRRTSYFVTRMSSLLYLTPYR